MRTSQSTGDSEYLCPVMLHALGVAEKGWIMTKYEMSCCAELIKEKEIVYTGSNTRWKTLEGGFASGWGISPLRLKGPRNISHGETHPYVKLRYPPVCLAFIIY